MKDINFCASSYLMYRYVYDRNKSFSDNNVCNMVSLDFDRKDISNGTELVDALKESIDRACENGKVALALSGGMDSAILARLVPERTKAYTFRCLVPGVNVIDESEMASKWAHINNLNHEIIDIYWEDIESVTDILMNHKGAPIHSIEAQIYIASRMAKESGFDKIIFGENADIIYGGMDGLLKKDWTYSEFVERYTYVMPYKVLKKPKMSFEPFIEFEKNGHIDGHDFINKYFRQEALGTYVNACETAGMEFVGPYSETKMKYPIDYSKVRNGESKYIVRDAFKLLYPGISIPDKIPMPRPVDEWFNDWEGPLREDFIPHCTDDMTGNQKWMVWALERYLNMMENENE